MDISIGKFTLESLTTGMYSEPESCYREYIQNAVDSIDMAIESGLLQLEDSRIEISFIDQSESDELAETDFFSKLGLLTGQKKAQTKYAALNINDKLTMEQRRILERVFDLITSEYDQLTAESFVNTISKKF